MELLIIRLRSIIQIQCTVREFKNNRNKMLPSCDLYFLKEDEICEFNLKNLKSYPGIFSQKLTLKVVLIFDQISKKKILLFLELQCHNKHFYGGNHIKTIHHCVIKGS